VKDAAQDVAENVTQDVAEDVLGAAQDGSSSVSGGSISITAVACPQLPPSPRPQVFFINGFFIIVARSLNVRSPLLVRQAQWQWQSTRGGRARKGRGERNFSGGGERKVCCGARRPGRAGLGLRGPGGARPHRHATNAAATAVFVQLALRWERNWAAQWHLARAVGKRVRGCRAKRLYVANAS